ncbi:MAG: hypothetical protein AABY22_22000, partial [Nanoarchaeota archaeon]
MIPNSTTNILSNQVRNYRKKWNYYFNIFVCPLCKGIYLPKCIDVHGTNVPCTSVLQNWNLDGPELNENVIKINVPKVLQSYFMSRYPDHTQNHVDGIINFYINNLPHDNKYRQGAINNKWHYCDFEGPIEEIL